MIGFAKKTNEMRGLVAIVFCLALAGCQTFWTKPGFNEADWNRDRYECDRDMRQSGYFGTGLLGELNAQSFFESCLVAKGYSKIDKSRSDPAPVPYDWSSAPKNVDHCTVCPDCASCRKEK